MCIEVNQITLMKKIDFSDIEHIMDHANYVINSKSNFLFSEDINNFIETLYFKKSCSLLSEKKLMATNCSNSIPGCLIANPF